MEKHDEIYKSTDRCEAAGLQHTKGLLIVATIASRTTTIATAGLGLGF